MRNRILGAITLAAGLALSPALSTTAVAQNAPSDGSGAQELAVEGLSKLLKALDLFVKSVPQYSAPEVLPNGDIILRRLDPKTAPNSAPDHTPPRKDEDDATST
jgi:hypothetical protein